MRSLWLATFLTLISIVLSSPTSNHVVHEKRTELPHHWVKRSKLDHRAVIPLRIALKQRNLDKVDDFMYDVAHPRSEKYGQHWSAKEVAEMFAPTTDDVQTVRDWLMNSGIAGERIQLSQSMGWLTTNVTISEAESLLKTEYFVFEHTKSGTPHVACQEYYVPADINKVVDFITPTVHFDAKVPIHEKPRHRPAKHELTLERKVRRKENHQQSQPPTINGGELGNYAGPVAPVRSDNAVNIGEQLGSLPKQGATLADQQVSKNLAKCDTQITPDCLRALYGFGPGTSANPQNSFGIVEYTPQSYVPSDLDKYFGNFSAGLKGSRPKFDSIDGGVLIESPQSFAINGESDLDLEVAIVLVAPQNVTLYQVGDTVQGASFNNFLDAIDGSYCSYEGGDDPTQDGIYPDSIPGGYTGPDNCGGFAATRVISTSYGYNEADLTPAYETRQCNEYMKLALQGVTVLYSSGDYGVAGNSGRCIDPASGNYTGTNANFGIFNPSFPSTCPWVTSVGATQVPNNTDIQSMLRRRQQPEQACELVIRSGGGFSNVFPLPDYQAKAVRRWFRNHPPPYSADRFNNSQHTRGYPDISANGANYVIAVDGTYSLIYGTSASAPTLGSIVTLINEERFKQGKGSVGFLNPVLYEHPEMLKDVTRGMNEGCGTNGFSAVDGWDPVTGLGTPIYPKMLDVFLNLPGSYGSS